jgi:density-regulated protein DRP1
MSGFEEVNTECTIKADEIHEPICETSDDSKVIKFRFDYSIALDTANALSVSYCGICSLPLEYCSYGVRYEECLAWRKDFNEEELAKMIGAVSIEGGVEEDDPKKKKGNKGIGSKKKTGPTNECKVIIARIQRQKRKYVTAIAGLDTVPNLKIKDAAKYFGKKFSSGCSIGDTATGSKEVVIQGDVSYELPALLVDEFKIPTSSIFILEDGNLKPAY